MSQVRVSDHAVLQWLKSVEGVDVDAIRHRIARAVRKSLSLRPEGVRVEGVTFKVQYNPGEAVVTYTHSPHTRTHLAQARLEPGDGED